MKTFADEQLKESSQPTLPRCGMGGGCALIQIRSSFSCAIDARRKNTGKAITAQIVDASWTEVMMNEWN